MYTPTEGEKELIRLTIAEKRNWEKGEAWVTDKVSFQMQNVVKKARKNYFGIFNEPTNPMTGREKIFIPITEWTVDTVLKNIDVDTKDIQVKADNFDTTQIANIFRYVLRKKLDDINFGQTLNDLIRNTAIDGTGFLKIWSEAGQLQIKVVDRSNMLYDPSARILDDSSAIAERNVLMKPEFDEYTEWENKEEVKTVKSLDKMGFGSGERNANLTEVSYVEVWERYGYVPKFVFTEDEGDRDKYTYALTVMSGLSTGMPVVHFKKEIKDHPYQEFQFKKVPGRLDGRGIAEMLFNIQAYINEVVNTRLDAGRIAQLRLWKLKGNITPQQFKRLWSTSAIKLDAASDIEPMQTGSIDPSSYKDEEAGRDWAAKVTQTEMNDAPMSAPATNMLLQQQGNSKGYNMRIEEIFLNLEKAMREKIVPIISKNLKNGEVVRITGNPRDMQTMDEVFVKHEVYQEIEDGKIMVFTDKDIEDEVAKRMQTLAKHGGDRFIETVKDLFDASFDVKVAITDETLNKATLAQAIMNILPILAQTGKAVDPALKELFDALGLDGEQMLQETAQPGQGAQGQPQGQLPAGQPLNQEQQAGKTAMPQSQMPASQMNAKVG